MLVDKDSHLPGQDRTETKLKPSQAMRIGAALRPQCTKKLFFQGASCALGAMWEGYGNPYQEGGPELYSLFRDFFPTDRCLVESIWYKNDFHGWSREQIAEWLESLGY